MLSGILAPRVYFYSHSPIFFCRRMQIHDQITIKWRRARTCCCFFFGCCCLPCKCMNGDVGSDSVCEWECVPIEVGSVSCLCCKWANGMRHENVSGEHLFKHTVTAEHHNECCSYGFVSYFSGAPVLQPLYKLAAFGNGINETLHASANAGIRNFIYDMDAFALPLIQQKRIRSASKWSCGAHPPNKNVFSLFFCWEHNA